MTSRQNRRPRRGPRFVGRVVLGFALAAALRVLVGGGGGAAWADDSSEARRHAQRATSLAASGKCRQAVAEFDKALAILRDPALLFNRGECHRKLGDAEAAIDDYKQFLSDLPKAPNRVEVEKRIAELQRKMSSPAAAPSPAGKAEDERPARRPAPTARDGADTRSGTTSSADKARSPGRSEPPPSRTAEAKQPREVILTPPPPAAGEGESAVIDRPVDGAAIATASDTAPASSGEGGVTSRPWFWIAIAVVAVGAGVGTFVLLNRDSTNVPSSALGNYKF